MKVALSGMVLGASMLGSNAASLSGEATFSGGHKLTFQNNRLTSTAPVDCEEAKDVGSAYHDQYPALLTGTLTAKAPDNIGQHDSAGELAYYCGIQGQTIATLGEASQQPGQQRILIKFTGEHESCSEGTILSSLHTEDTDGNRYYKPKVSTSITYPCFKRQDHVSPQVTASLNAIRKDAAATFVLENSIVDNTYDLTRKDGSVYDIEGKELTFDLGYSEPIAAYYDAKSCSSDNQMCLGGVQTHAIGTSGANGLGSDFSTGLVTSAGVSWNQQPTYYKLSQDSCLTRTFFDSPTANAKEACGLTLIPAQDTSEGQGMLNVFDCPFRQQDYLVSSDTNVQACLDLGAGQSLPNTCSDRSAYDVAEAVELEDSEFTVNLAFKDDANYHEQEPVADLKTDDTHTDVPASQSTVTWTIVAQGDISSAKNLRFVEINDAGVVLQDGTKITSITVVDGSFSVTVPARTHKMQLRGTVQKRDCSNDEHALGNIDLSVTAQSVSEGTFTKSQCDDFYTVNVAAGEEVKSVTGNSNKGTLDATSVQFCDALDSKEDCLVKIGLGTNPKTSTGKALVTYLNSGKDVCEGVPEDDVAAIIGFGSHHQYVPIICPETCKEFNLGSLTLDWHVNFGASLTSGDDYNYIVALERSEYNGEYKSIQKESFLAPDNVCGADGSLSAQPADGCTLAAIDAYADSAPELKDKFDACGSSGGAFVVQSFVITLKNDDKMEFCNAKEVSLDIEDMQGQSQASIVIAASTDLVATPIHAEISFVGYRPSSCPGDKQVLAVDIETDALTGNATYVGTDAVFGTKSISGGLITYETECIDVCTAKFDLIYDLKAIVSENERLLDFDMSVQVLGTPCMDSPAELKKGRVTLSLFGVEKDSTCDGGVQIVSPEVVKDKVCASLETEDFESSTLKVLDETLVRTAPNSASTVITNTLFFLDTAGSAKELIGAGDTIHYSSGERQLPETDAFTTYTLTVYWEQVLSTGGRRLLRSTHVFGAGDHEARSSLVILPPSAQIQDAAESLDGSQGDAPAEDAPDEDAPAKEDSGLSGGAIAGIIAGGIVVAGGIALVAVQAQGGARKPEAAGYSVVRRSERFSTMNF